MASSRFMIISLLSSISFIFFTDPAPSEIYTLSLHDALPIFDWLVSLIIAHDTWRFWKVLHRPVENLPRSEEHTSELQSRFDLVCRLLLEKKKLRHPSTM